jgi:hypothetical protein
LFKKLIESAKELKFSADVLVCLFHKDFSRCLTVVEETLDFFDFIFGDFKLAEGLGEHKCWAYQLDDKAKGSSGSNGS